MPLIRWLALLVALVTLSSCSGYGSSNPAKPQALSAAGMPSPHAAPASPTESPLSVDHWVGLYKAQEPELDRESERLSKSGDSTSFYTLAYELDAKGSLFDATGDFTYAGQGLHFAMNMIASARPSKSLRTSSFKDGYLGWLASDNENDETPLYESYAWRYVTRLLRLVQPVLAHAPTNVQAQYSTVLKFTETNIVEKWLSRGADDDIYRSRTHMASHWAMIALDVSRLTADPKLRQQCIQIVQNIDNHLPNYRSSLRQQLHPNPRDPQAYWWSDVWGDTSRPGQDVSHGSGVIAYVVEAADLGTDWSTEDIARFSRTLTDFVLGTDGRFPEYIDGTGQSNGWLADGWVKLGGYDPAVQAVLETYPVQNDQYLAAMAENAHRLATRTSGG